MMKRVIPNLFSINLLQLLWAGCRARLSPDFLRYFAVSAAALTVDTICLYVLWQWLHFAAGPGIISYLIGDLFHYTVSRRVVFAHRRREFLRRKTQLEYFAWLCCSLVGMSITALILYVGVDRMELPLLLIKGLAVPLSFLTVWGLKSRLLFPLLTKSQADAR